MQFWPKSWERWSSGGSSGGSPCPWKKAAAGGGEEPAAFRIAAEVLTSEPISNEAACPVGSLRLLPLSPVWTTLSPNVPHRAGPQDTAGTVSTLRWWKNPQALEPCYLGGALGPWLLVWTTLSTILSLSKYLTAFPFAGSPLRPMSDHHSLCDPKHSSWHQKFPVNVSWRSQRGN